MTRTPDVTANNPITDEWGNEIRDRTVQRYASAAARSSEHPSPEAGDMSYLADKGRVEVFHSAAWRAIGAVPTGAIIPYAGTSAPDGWSMCDGGSLSTSTEADLFAVIGYTFGGSGGSFNKPDLRQRFPLGVAESGTGNTLGATGGTIDHNHSGPAHTHGVGSLATASAGVHNHGAPDILSAGAHTHTFSDSFTTGSPNGSAKNVADGGTIAAAFNHTHSGSVSGTTSSSGAHIHSQSNGHRTTNDGAHTHTITGSTASGGTGSTGTANPPFIALNYIIKL